MTELTAGSGFYAPTLFDRYSSFSLRPAAMFALPVVRRPGGRTVTLLGGGYHASGPAGKDRLPEPHLPAGLRLDPMEGAGEVQTPVTGDAARSLPVGANVYMRHAKAGELCERFDTLHLVAGRRDRGRGADVPRRGSLLPLIQLLGRNRRRERVLGATITRSMAHLPGRVTLIATVVALAAAALAPAHAAGQAVARPNIVFVMTDDQTADSLRVMSKVRSGLLNQGTQFTRAVASYPLCCPSRATYLTGQYAHNHGVIHNAGAFGGYTRLDHTNALPVWLQQVGYRTIHVGRYLNGYGTQNPDPTEIPPGWNDWYSTLDPSTFDFKEWLMNENGRILRKPGSDHPGEYQTDYLGRRAGDMIRRAAPSSQPFFLSLTFPAPHSSDPIDSDDPPTLRTPSPAPRHRDAFAASPLPQPPSFNEARIGDKPADHRRPAPHHTDRLRRDPGELPAGAGVAAVGGRRRRRCARRPVRHRRAGRTR